MKAKLLIVSLLLCLNSFGQKLPITNLCLSDIVAVTGGTCLSDAFTNANSGYFDANYAIAGANWLSEFRNYGVIYYSAAIYGYYTRDDCSSGYSGTEVLIDFVEGYYTSYDSQIDADNQAESDAQAYANANGDCIADETTYYSAAFYDWFMSNDGHCDAYVSENCGTCNGVEGYTATQCAALSGTWENIGGGAWVYYTSSYGDYTSTISQADADAQAQAAAQAAANAASCECNSVPQ